MLEILRLPRRSAVRPIMESFDSTSTCWVVSDLRSKQEMQTLLLDRDGGYLDTSVLRASDLWKLLLKKTRPEIRVVSRDFVGSIVRAFLEEYREVLGRRGASERAVLSAMDRFAGVVFHPRGDELMTEWFEENPDSNARWGETYLIARLTLNKLKSENLIIAKWAAAVLQSEADFERHWNQPLIVDLGAEMTGAEAQLFLRLSRVTDVCMLRPSPSWQKQVDGVLRPYAEIEGLAMKASDLPDPGAVQGKTLQVLRLSGQLAEVKAAVAKARHWIDSGTKPQEIAILAPEIEDYWSVLKAYLDEEGIPADKAVAVKLSAFPSVSRWMARLRSRKGDLTSADLELSYYGADDSSRMRYEEFHALFANLYGAEDLQRSEKVKQAFLQGPTFQERMNRDDFLLTSVQLWDRREDLAPLLLMGREVLQNALASTNLPLNEWITYLDAVAAGREMSISAADPNGVLVTNLPSARTSTLRRRLFLGLTEEGLRKAEPNPLPLNDVRRLSELGFHLDHPDQSIMEFELRWLADAGSEEDIFLTGASSFEGSVRSPAAFWLQMQRQLGESGHTLSLPEATRWDLLQTSAPPIWNRERNWSEQRGSELLTRLKVDLGDQPPALVHAPAPARLSPSFIRTYGDCPFQAAANGLFRLKDLEEIDLDMARSGLGTLTHAVFQALTDQGWTELEKTDAEIEALIQSQRDQMKLILAEESWWPSFLRRQTRVVREFLRVEKEWKAQYPKLKLLTSEQAWNLYFDPKTGVFEKDSAEGRLQISGRIDRLESDGADRFVVIDYKASATALTDQADWLKQNDLQLLFYMWALEKGALENVSGHVIGAFYYVYRDFSRTRGFQLEDEAGILYPASVRKNKKSATAEDKAKLLQALEERIATVVSRIQQGHWEPDPRDRDICERCSWTVLCRASHLN